jgi:hypothetical protein
MRIQRTAILALFTAGLAALPLSTAEAQYIYPCNPFPLFWPFCAAATVVGTAATIATAPFRAIAGAPYYGPYRPYYYPPPGAYYPAGTNGSPYAYYDGRR